MTSTACRMAFGKELLTLAEKDDKIVVLCSDSRGSCSVTEFGEKFPNQMIEVGIAEQDEIGIAAGLATVGYKPFVCAPASFLCARSLEQIKIDVAYSNTNVKIFGVSGGVSYGELGFSHHSTHDLAVMSCIPNLAVIVPSDATQTAEMVKSLVNVHQPAYIRVGRGPVEDIYPNTSYKGKPFVFGKANCVNEGSDVTIIACGELVAPALHAAEDLEAEGLHIRVLDMATIKPLDREAVLKALHETGAILTVEEHSIYGGLGAVISQVACQCGEGLVSNLAFPNEFPYTGNGNAIKAHYGLDKKGIIEATKKLIERKKR